jgi:simple sugar transport system ATP-binding protein
MGIMRSLKEQGTSIVFITHKLREVKAVGDRITVIRRGKVVGTAPPTAPEQELAEMMVGRAVQLVVDKAPPTVGRPVLRVDHVTVVDPRGATVVKDVSLEARAGEVLGIAGVQGNGQTELVKTLLGLVRPDAGSITLDGRELTREGPRGCLDAGIGYIPEDRSHDGYVGAFTVRENLVLDLYGHETFARGPALRLDAIEANAKERIEEFDIRCESADSPVSSLSGGNQQKVVVAREFSRPIKLLLASQPTRGVDVGSIEFIHARIVQERDRGTAVVIVSTELDEIYALSDRIAVMYDGRIVGTVGPDTPREEVGLMMAGAHGPTAGPTVGRPAGHPRGEGVA